MAAELLAELERRGVAGRVLISTSVLTCAERQRGAAAAVPRLLDRVRWLDAR
jgi:hypothetical protein